jgi:hypothetical protein
MCSRGESMHALLILLILLVPVILGQEGCKFVSSPNSLKKFAASNVGVLLGHCYRSIVLIKYKEILWLYKCYKYSAEHAIRLNRRPQKRIEGVSTPEESDAEEGRKQVQPII